MPCPNNRRKRTISKAFRVTPEESERIELLAKAAGITQQEYIMMRLEEQDFIIEPDMRTYKALKDYMQQVYQELCRLRSCSQMDELLISKVELLSDLFVGVATDASNGVLAKEDSIITGIERG